jgi:hypothetical protein
MDMFTQVTFITLIAADSDTDISHVTLCIAVTCELKCAFHVKLLIIFSCNDSLKGETGFVKVPGKPVVALETITAT